MQYPLQDIPKGAGTLNVTRVHQGLTFVIDYDKDDPGEAEEKDEAI
jgi:hypothetical protein